MPDKSRRFPLWLKVLIVLGVLAGAFYFALVYSRPTALVEAVISGDAIDAKPGSVTVKEEYLMQMKSQLGGRVLNKGYHLDPGMKVKEGDLLVHLDTGDVEIEIEAVQNDYNAVKQKIASARPRSTCSSPRSPTSSTRSASSRWARSPTATTRRRAAPSRRPSSSMALEKVLNEENLESDENTLKAKHREKDKMTVTAPFDGQISEVFAHPGDLIQPGSPIVSIITTTRLVQAKISEEDFANIKEGQEATVIFLPYGEWYNGDRAEDPADGRPPDAAAPGGPRDDGHRAREADPGHHGRGLDRRRPPPREGHHPAPGAPQRERLRRQGRQGGARKVKAGFEWLTGAEILEGLEPGEQVIVEDLRTSATGRASSTQELPSDVFSKKK
jgi:biotin carboxyl carrier protein